VCNIITRCDQESAMSHRYADIAFTPTIRALQEQMDSRELYARMDAIPDKFHRFRDREIDFLRQRDSFYMATVTEDGWPYIQHRGGPAGFIKVLDDQTLGFADYSGNRQYITTGNLINNARVSLFFMDYPQRKRMKLLGRAETLTLEDERLAQLADPDYDARIERGFLIHLAAFDWNCPQHITPRYTEQDVQQRINQAVQDVLANQTHP
jgi:predicted pyridoxine 5'-phosphate oxidase superfamily flavin-nucleotide-binding protein